MEPSVFLLYHHVRYTNLQVKDTVASVWRTLQGALDELVDIASELGVEVGPEDRSVNVPQLASTVVAEYYYVGSRVLRG